MPEQQGRAFVVMPFGRKLAADGTPIDFDAVYERLYKPAIEAAGLRPHRADAERRGGSIHADMFQDLLLAEMVVADLTIDNPNVWYEIGVRHALRASGAVLTYALRDRLPFDLNGQRMMRYGMAGGAPDPATLAADRALITEAIVATLGAWRHRKASPVYAQLPNLREPDWKSLKVGQVNEYWEALEAWQARIELARQAKRPGDILTLAEETPNSLLAFEALRTAGIALLAVKRPRYALAVLKRAREIDPDDVVARQQEAVALGRDNRFAEATQALRQLAEEERKAGQPSGETLGLLARTRKDDWRRLLDAEIEQGVAPPQAARDTAPSLLAAASAYVEGFRAAPVDYYPGINALSLGRLWEHATGRSAKLPLDAIASALGWTIDSALAGAPEDADRAAAARARYWAIASRAELALLRDEPDATIEALEEAAALAVEHRLGFELDSTRQQLVLFERLGFRAAIVGEARAVIVRAEQQIDALVGARPAAAVAPTEPARVVLFSGHMVDRPDRARPRFPADKAEAAGHRIGAELDALGIGRGDLAIAQAAAGGDLLFARACLARGMRLWVMLPQEEPAFLSDSVSWAGTRWQQEYDALRAGADVVFRVLPAELGPVPEGVDIYVRCNRWMMHTALSQGLGKVFFVTLWDGAGGDGPGGTAHMVSLVQDLTGRQPVVIDPGTLC